MRKNIKRFYKDEKGNALILVVLLVLCMFLIVGAVMAVSSSHFEISQAYKRTSNLYYAAQSGAEKMVDNLNKTLIEKMPEIIKNVADEEKGEVVVTEENPSTNYSNLEYKKDSSLYDGNFSFKDVYDKIKEEAINQVLEEIKGDDGKIEFEYQVKDESNISEVTVILKQEDDDEDTLKVTSTAVLKNEEKELSEITLEGKINLSVIDYNGILLEEYNWKDGNIPNTFRSPILTFGDFVVTNGANVTIKGDVRTKGYLPPEKNEDNSYPELEEYGGIYVSDGGNLTIDGDVITLANLHTIKKSSDKSKKNKIIVTGDVFANSVVIEDDYPYFDEDRNSNGDRKISDRVTGQNITINGDVYVDNDIAIDRYVEGRGDENNPDIWIKGNVFGITNIDLETTSDPNPNKASGIYAMGENTKIKIDGNALVHGNAFISFDGGKSFSALYESMGEPFEDVSFLDAYSPASDDTYKADGDDRYLDLRKDAIKKDKIILDIKDHYFYAPEKISANGSLYDGHPYDGASNPIKTHNEFDEKEELLALFNRGDYSDTKPLTEEGLKELNSKWEENTLISESSYDIIDIIRNAYEYLKGDKEANPFERKYFEDVEAEKIYNSTQNYRGVQGYMFIKRDIFYKTLEKVSDEQFSPVYMSFEGDIINSNTEIIAELDTLEKNNWTKDNPLYVLDTSSEDEKEIYVKDFYDGNSPINTVIIDKGSGSIILKADDKDKEDTFNGIIISNGRVVFDGVENFNGIIIAKGQQDEKGKIYTQQLARGEYAGVLIKQDLTINYDENILFKTIFKDKSLKRLVFDYLGITNYMLDTSDVEEILKSSIAIEPIQKVDFDSKSVIEINQNNESSDKFLQFELIKLYQKD